MEADDSQGISGEALTILRDETMFRGTKRRSIGEFLEGAVCRDRPFASLIHRWSRRLPGEAGEKGRQIGCQDDRLLPELGNLQTFIFDCLVE